MQTFLPYESYEDSARALDYRRLGKQRVEAWQILNALRGYSTKGWVNHPATKMWRGHEFQLALYGATMCAEWIQRGYNDTMFSRFSEAMRELPHCSPPSWIPDVTLSHQSNLIRKLPEHYTKLFTAVPADLPYVWPVK
jgi:hypothetical protein